MDGRKILVVGGAALVLAVACAVHGKSAGGEQKDCSSKTAESTVVTNDNGSVSRNFVECTVTTNGSMVIEHRRETRTNMDMNGNMLETSTSEYTQSYPVGDTAVRSLSAPAAPAIGARTESANADSFLGLKFGEEFEGTNFVQDVDEPALLRATFTPKKPLADFDDYYVYVTPKTHKVVKVYACAKEAVEPGMNSRRHYLIEAFEKKYSTWARLCSYFRPLYRFEIGEDRHATVCLTDASRDYETVICAWDGVVASIAADEWEALREEARKTAAEKRNRRVADAQDAF